MTDLMQALYDYAQENRIMDYLHNDPEYRSALHRSEKQRLALQSSLTEPQAAQLEHLLETRTRADSEEMRAIFQCGFSMAVELLG